MKRLFLLSLVLLISVLNANVIIPRAVARVWFDETDNFIVLLGAEAENVYDFNALTFTTSAGDYAFPEGYTLPGELPCIVNFTQAIPGFTIQRSEDHFIAHTNLPWSWDEQVTWGSQNDLSVNLHPLTAGQSAVQYFEYDWDGYEYYTVTAWAKDDSTSVAGYPYSPAVECTLRVHVDDENGNPVEGYPVYTSFTDYQDTNCTPYYTNEYGDWQRQYFYAIRTHIWIKDMATQAFVTDEIIFPEPGETCLVNAVISSAAGHDPSLVPPTGILKINPSVVTRSSGNTLHLKFEASRPLNRPGELTFYDLRGRALANMQMPVTGQTEWTLPSLPSGIYFVGLSYSGRQLARQRLTIIK